VKDDTYKDWTAALTDTASEHGVNSTPTIMVAGKPIEAPASGPQTVEALLAAVVQAVDKASAK
jgi:protein-disulfide isomerase